ncbi:MAG TPA: hypothetical protein VIS27_01570 [Yeosuana sp.]
MENFNRILRRGENRQSLIAIFVPLEFLLPQVKFLQWHRLDTY